MLLTALAGFLASLGMLKMGLGEMWLRYPLAVLFGWGVLLSLVRGWAGRERDRIRVHEELAEIAPEGDFSGNEPRRSVLEERESRGGWLDWLDWLNPFDVLGEDVEGCLVGVAILVAMVAFGGAVLAVAGMIMQADVLLAELLLDVLLVSALNKRLHGLDPRWWLEDTLRQTVWPVVVTMVFLLGAGYLMGHFAPGAESIGQVWAHWRGAW